MCFLTIFDLTMILSFLPQNQNSYLCSRLHVSCNVNLVKYAQVVCKILRSLFTDAWTCTLTMPKNWIHPMTNCPHWWHGSGAYGFWRSGRFPLRNPKERSLSRVSQFGLQVYGGAKISGTPSTACVRRAFWQYHYLWGFSGVDTRAPGIKSDWCIYGIRAVYGCLAVWEPHQPPMMVSPLATVTPGDCFLSPIPDGPVSYEGGSRSMLVYRLVLFSQLKCIISLGTWKHWCPR